MFNTLTDKFNDVFRQLSGRGKISASNVGEAMEQVRSALLEADVHYEIVDSFVKTVTERAIGTEVLESLKPGQQMIKIVHDELLGLISGDEDPAPMMYVQPGPTIVMMCGLQGSGKTTTCGKLATYLKNQGKSVMLCAADLQRPAAVHQLQVLSEQAEAEGPGTGTVHFYGEPERVAEYGKAVGAAVKVAANAVKAARKTGSDVLVIDTAGRLHINDELMGELKKVNQATKPHQIYLVIDAMTGQDAVNSAKAFNDQLELDGVILTKFDSDTRGGAALTVRQVTGKPIKFIGTGEHLDALEEFHPDRIVSRILGMGDIVGLVEKAQSQVSEEEALALQEKMAQGTMTMEDFLKQLKTMRKMGSMKGLLGMLPGIGHQMRDVEFDDSEMNRAEAMIQSMTRHERHDVDVINNSRRRRIASGSGTTATDVSQLVKGFGVVSQMGKQMSSMSMLQRMKSLAGLGSADLSAFSTGKAVPKLAGASHKPKAKYKQRRRRSR